VSRKENRKSVGVNTWHDWPWSTRLWIHYETFEQLPFLEDGLGLLLWLGLGTTLLVGLATWAIAVFLNLSDSSRFQLDPLLGNSIPLNAVIWSALFVFTSFMAFKQRSYYYGVRSNLTFMLSRKDGLFINKIRQANNAERLMDFSLAIIPGFLTGLCILPTLWFLTFGLYSCFVAMRCYISLKRPLYARRLMDQGQHVPGFLFQTLEQRYREDEYDEKEKDLSTVKFILSGWVISHSLYAFLGFTILELQKSFCAPATF